MQLRDGGRTVSKGATKILNVFFSLYAFRYLYTYTANLINLLMRNHRVVSFVSFTCTKSKKCVMEPKKLNNKRENVKKGKPVIRSATHSAKCSA